MGHVARHRGLLPINAHLGARALRLAGFVFGEVGAAFVVVEVVVDGVVLAGVAARHLGAATVVFLVLGLCLRFVVHMEEI